jgi:hypothetical protein
MRPIQVEFPGVLTPCEVSVGCADDLADDHLYFWFVIRIDDIAVVTNDDNAMRLRVVLRG